jgi:hypothetical protein
MWYFYEIERIENENKPVDPDDLFVPVFWFFSCVRKGLRICLYCGSNPGSNFQAA